MRDLLLLHAETAGLQLWCFRACLSLFADVHLINPGEFRIVRGGKGEEIELGIAWSLVTVSSFSNFAGVSLRGYKPRFVTYCRACLLNFEFTMLYFAFR